MTTLDLFAEAEPQIVALHLPLAGRHLIEASAGTGKTWTLSALFVRLVIEGEFTVEQVLAVTFTRAATAELRQRIRQRLAHLVNASETDRSDPLSYALLRRDAERARRRAKAALFAFDSAPIYTIHGFAQRALSERAFSAGIPFDFELGETRAVWLEAVRDFWRGHVAAWRPEDGLSALAHEDFVSRLIAQGDTPKSWALWLLRVRAAREARLDRGPGTATTSFEELKQLHLEAFEIWRDAREDVLAILLGDAALNRRKYSRAHVPRWCSMVDAFFASGELIPAADSLDKLARLTASTLGESLAPNYTEAPYHPFFVAFDDFIAHVLALDASFIRWRQQLLQKLFEETPPLVAARLAKMRVLGFDDLLTQLLDALKSRQGAVFAAALRERFPCALIDEFQDTDAIQEQIFTHIYHDARQSPVFLVGDPKQAIYRFRGADVYTYLAAARRSDQQHDLRENHRAVPGLIAALNVLFARNPDVFEHQGIRYREAVAADRERVALIEDGACDAAPLRFMVPKAAEAALDAPEADALAASSTANEIARLLELARDEKLRLGDRSLAGGDIAVLVNSNWQGTLIRQELRQRAIAVADRSRGSVFQSDEADWLLLLLLALLQPHRTDRIRNALATPLYGFSARDLLAVDAAPVAWQELLDELAHFRDVWHLGGVLRLLRELFASVKGAQRLAASIDGERHLTNLFHLGELIQHFSGSGANALAQATWLAERMENASEEVDINEVAELRLESDSNLVQVLTLHKSKGLEFPLVFVPFLFSGRSQDSAAAIGARDLPLDYHDEANGDQHIVDFGSERYGLAAAQVAIEKRSEEARLLYVGLTRATHRCVIFWCYAKSWALAPLASLITASRTPAQPALNEAGVKAQLAALAATSDNQIAIVDVPPLTILKPESGAARRPLQARRLHAPLVSPWRLASFSSLQRRSRARSAIEEPDHDQDAPLPEPALGAATPNEPSDLVRFTFARGAAAGECLHRILEALPPDSDAGKIARIASEILRQHGFPVRLAPELALWIEEVLATPLFERGFALDSIAASEQIREMEFHLPLKRADVASIAALARAHGLDVAAIHSEQLEGFLKGFVDLIVRHDGRFYLIDYKSNWLGDRFANYEASALASAMTGGGYTLQYLIYTVALVRWLRFRDADFDYERDFGGVCYLFLRGIAPGKKDAEGRPCGVFFARPQKSLIDELDRTFEGHRR